MRSAPINPPGGPHIPPFWRDEDNWIVLIEFLPQHDAEDRDRATQTIGYMLAYSQMTDTRMLALVGDPAADAYELLFSFNSLVNKEEFLRLLKSNEITDCEDEMILFPVQKKIDAAQPLSKVLPIDVFQRVTLIATTLQQFRQRLIHAMKEYRLISMPLPRREMWSLLFPDCRTHKECQRPKKIIYNSAPVRSGIVTPLWLLNETCVV